MVFQQQLVLFIMAFMYLSYEHEVVAQWVPPYTSVVAQVLKHTDLAKPLFSVQIMTKYVNMNFIHTNFLIDIDAPFICHDCIVQWNMNPNSCPGNTICLSPYSCEDYQCTDIRTSSSYQQYSSSCPPATNSSTLPGWGVCSCPVDTVDPINGSCGEALLNSDELFFNATNGRNAFPDFYRFYPDAACAPSYSFDSFPANVSGVMALSTSPNAPPSYIFGVAFTKSFSLCLPSSVSNTGVFLLVHNPKFYYVICSIRIVFSISVM
ncbi:uncharacterized protein [Rutidosis leptorrhynchoides]|uniref:uncharacterized protein n=1 Tax=Rutidosis leptorrhynchoides TaxID=125765 RepID=UPI003A99C502